jgi:hypothetical protein
MGRPDGKGKMVNYDHKKVVWKRYSTEGKGMLEYAGDPPAPMIRPLSLNTHCGRSPASLGGIDYLI